MNKLLILSFSLLATIAIEAQGVSQFLNKLEDGDDYAVVTVNREMFKMLAAMDIEMEEPGLKELIRSIKLLKVYIKDDGGAIEDFNNLNNLAKSSSMNNLVSVKDKSERVMLYTGASKSDEIVDGILLLVHDDNENVFLQIDGLINLNHLSSLAKNMDIKGLDSLKKIDKKF